MPGTVFISAKPKWAKISLIVWRFLGERAYLQFCNMVG